MNRRTFLKGLLGVAGLLCLPVAGVAQTVEQRTRNAPAAGSIPAASSSDGIYPNGHGVTNKQMPHEPFAGDLVWQHDIPDNKTYYVSSSNGHDSNEGSATNPLRSIAEAVSRAGDYDTIILRGDFAESVPAALHAKGVTIRGDWAPSGLNWKKRERAQLALNRIQRRALLRRVGKS